MSCQLAGSAQWEWKAATSLVGIKALSVHMALTPLWQVGKLQKAITGKAFFFFFLIAGCFNQAET